MPIKPLYDSDDKAGGFHKRLLVAAVFVGFGLVALIVQLYRLQVLGYDNYQTLAEKNRIRPEPIEPLRGKIMDRYGEVLADNKPAYSLEIMPDEVKAAGRTVNQTIDELNEIITISADDRQALKESRGSAVPIRSQLTEEDVARFTEQRYRFPGVEVQARLFRNYPNKALGAHIVGHLHRITKTDEENFEISGDRDNYFAAKFMGKLGIEATYENDLRGQLGREEVERTAGNKRVRSLGILPSKPGNNLYLTIDLGLQRVAEQEFGERRGAVVALDPRNGEVLALVSMPAFDPNLFVGGISGANWNYLNQAIDKPMLNRAIASAYPPGSTFKPFMALAGLSAGKRDLIKAMPDPGFFTLGNHTFMDDKKGGHGLVTLHRSIVVSCNTYYYSLANDLTIDGISGFMPQVGLGSLTGIDLPGEKEGVLPSQAWKKKRFEKRGPEQQKWYSGETISIGIGQGYNAYTPIQMATALASIANDGKLVRPHLVKTIETVNGNTSEYHRVPVEVVSELTVEKEYLAAVRAALEDVIAGGTGYRAFAGAPYKAAGKTGTAQVYSLKGGAYNRSNERMRDHSWFIAYAPAEKPTIALAVLVENGGFGAVSAAPIARKVIDYYLLGKHGPEATGSAEIIDSEDEEADEHDHEHEATDQGVATPVPATVAPRTDVRQGAARPASAASPAASEPARSRPEMRRPVAQPPVEVQPAPSSPAPGPQTPIFEMPSPEPPPAREPSQQPVLPQPSPESSPQRAPQQVPPQAPPPPLPMSPEEDTAAVMPRELLLPSRLALEFHLPVGGSI